MPFLAEDFGSGLRAHIEQAGPPDADGWTTLTLLFESLYDARSRLLSWGGDIEVLEPDVLRMSIVDFAHQTLARYSG
jgi:predicted DNA-binding transcriptional regulator YafY